MPPPAPSAAPGPVAWSLGPCTDCGGEGTLLLLRRLEDGALLRHCPVCGLVLLHDAPGEDAPAGWTLPALAPGGTAAAGPEEIRAAGLEGRVRPLDAAAMQALLERRRLDPAAEGPPPRTGFPAAALRRPSPLAILWLLFTILAFAVGVVLIVGSLVRGIF